MDLHFPTSDASSSYGSFTDALPGSSPSSEHYAVPLRYPAKAAVWEKQLEMAAAAGNWSDARMYARRLAEERDPQVLRDWQRAADVPPLQRSPRRVVLPTKGAATKVRVALPKPRRYSVNGGGVASMPPALPPSSLHPATERQQEELPRAPTPTDSTPPPAESPAGRRSAR